MGCGSVSTNPIELKKDMMIVSDSQDSSQHWNFAKPAETSTRIAGIERV